MILIDRRVEEFLAVANAGSISRAARMLYISQPTLSAQIKHLEKDLGFELFERKPTGVILTSQGEVFRDDMLEICRLEQGAIARGRQPSHAYRDLVIGFVAPTEARALADIIADYQYIHPDLSITFRVVPQDLSLRIRLVAEHYVDCVLADMRSSDKDDTVGFTSYYLDEDCLVIPPTDPLASADYLQAQDLSGRTLAIPHEEHPTSVLTLLCQELKDMNADIGFEEHIIDSAFIEGLRYTSQPFIMSMSIARMLDGIIYIPLRYNSEKPWFGMLYCLDTSSAGKNFATFVAQYYQLDNSSQEV